ncbi:phage portal protein [Clostridium sp.]|uniref:phage portal protein n=1 Tax=Clostridium sp. TaxID=1506 RepID=UPI00260FA259|nr:phage portal protein [Clostridium sp.]
MGLFNKKNVEERSLSYNALIESLSNNKIYISKNTVEKIPVVHESIKKIAGTIAALPVELMVKDRFKNTIIDNDIRLYLLNTENNNYQNAYNYKYRIVEDLLLYGKHYSYIERKGIKIIGLYPIEYKTVTEKDVINENGVIVDKTINYSLNNMVQTRNAYDVLIIDTGNKGILNSNKLLELMISHDEMLQSVIENISMPSGYLKSSGRLTEATINRMRTSWKDIYTGGKNAAKTIILEEGLDYKQLDVNLNNIQSLENKKIFVEDVERLFSLYDVKSDSEYLKYTIAPLVSCIENALSCQLLLTTEKEKNTMFLFNCEMVDRADEKTRIEAIALAVDKGLLTINEARLRLDENPFLLDTQEEFLSLSQGKIMLLKDGKVVIPNMGTSLNIDDEAVKPEGENNGEDI